MNPDSPTTLDPQNQDSSHSVQFEEDGIGSSRGFNGYPTQPSAPKGFVGMPNSVNLSNPNFAIMSNKRIPLLYRLLIKWNLAKNVRHAKAVALAAVIVLFLIAGYFIFKALAPAHVVQVRFTKPK